MPKNVKLQALRKRMARKNIFKISDLAKLVGCRRETIYFALDNPARYPVAYASIQKATE